MRGTRHWWGRGADAVEESEEGSRGGRPWGVNEITRPELFDASLVNVFGHLRVRAAAWKGISWAGAARMGASRSSGLPSLLATTLAGTAIKWGATFMILCT